MIRDDQKGGQNSPSLLKVILDAQVLGKSDFENEVVLIAQHVGHDLAKANHVGGPLVKVLLQALHQLPLLAELVISVVPLRLVDQFAQLLRE